MKSHRFIRNYIHKRYSKIEKKVHKSDFSLKNNPYTKLKAYFTIEIASFILSILLKTKISPNAVSIAGVVWCSIGSILINIENKLSLTIGIIFLFTKIIPDIVDGNLANLKKESSFLGHEFDLWAGNISRVIVMIGFTIYAINHNPYGTLEIFYIFLVILTLLSLADLRYHFIKFKKIHFHKNLKTHEILKQKKKNNNIKTKNSNYFIELLKLAHFNARSRYTDFLLLLIILEWYIFEFNVIYLFPAIWFFTYTLAFLKSIHLTLKK